MKRRVKKPTDVGTNRTGLGASPIDARRLLAAAARSKPSRSVTRSLGDVRIEYGREGSRVGSVPPPTSFKGAKKALFDLAKGEKTTVLLDRIGERLGFERAGVRVYEALLAKLDARGSWSGGPSRSAIVEQLEDELTHFHAMKRVLESLGADPTTTTPAADLGAVETMGILTVVTDPRTTVADALHAILMGELACTAHFEHLIELASALGVRELAAECETYRNNEEVHSVRVRAWLRSYDLRQAGARMDAA